MKAIKINNKLSHDIYFSVNINGMEQAINFAGQQRMHCEGKCLVAMGGIKRCYCQWQVEETDYLTFHFRHKEVV